MIAALIILGFMGTIALLIWLGITIVAFIHDYNKFQKRDDNLDYAVIDYSTLKRLYQVNPDGYESAYGQLYRIKNNNGWKTREIRIIFKTIFDYIRFEVDKNHNKKTSHITKRRKQEEQGLSKLRDLAQQDIDNLRTKLDAEFEQEKKKTQEIAANMRRPLGNLKPLVYSNGDIKCYYDKAIYIDELGYYFTKDGKPILMPWEEK